MVKANCRSRNEFLGEALQFYCDYLAAKDVDDGSELKGAVDRVAKCEEQLLSLLNEKGQHTLARLT